MKELSGDALLRLTVRLHGLQLGRPVDLMLDSRGTRAVGLDVLCRDEVHRFLPLATAAVGDEQMEIESPLVLLDEEELAFYRSRGLALSALRGRAVFARGGELGPLVDVIVAPDGELVALVVETAEQRTRVPYDEFVSLAPVSRSAA